MKSLRDKTMKSADISLANTLYLHFIQYISESVTPTASISPTPRSSKSTHCLASSRTSLSSLSLPIPLPVLAPDPAAPNAIDRASLLSRGLSGTPPVHNLLSTAATPGSFHPLCTSSSVPVAAGLRASLCPSRTVHRARARGGWELSAGKRCGVLARFANAEAACEFQVC